MSGALEHREEIRHGREADAARAELSSRENFGLKLVLISQNQALADADFASGADQALPLIRILADLSRKQYLHFPMQEVTGGGIAWADGLRFRAATAAKKSSREYFRVVEDQEIVGTQKVGKIPKPAVM